MNNNEYLWMEDIKSNKVLEFVDNLNAEFNELVGDLRHTIAEGISKYYNVEKVDYAFGFRDGVFILVNTGKVHKVIRYTHDGELIEIISSDKIGKEVMFLAALPSWDGSVMCLFYTTGSDRGFFRFMEVDSGSVIYEFRDFLSQIFWLDNNRYLYIRAYRDRPTPDGVKPPAYRVYLRELGSDKEELVFGEGLPTNYHMYVNRDYRLRWMYLNVRRGWTATRVYWSRFGDAYGWRLLYDAGENYAFASGYLGGKHLVTVYDGNKLGRVVGVSDSKYTTVYQEDTYPVSNAFVYSDKLFLIRSIHASSHIYMLDDDGLREVRLDIDVPITLRNFGWTSRHLFYIVESFSIPSSLYMFNEDFTGSRPIFSSKVDIDVVVEEDFVESHDGVNIHYFMVRNRDRDAKIALVHGYGGFGISMTPSYLGYILKFIEDGGVYVLANLRGGCEYGEKWHEMGMKEKKFNVFYDYLAVLRRLREKGYKIIGFGRSNGGLLITATLNMDPEIMDLAIVGYPLTDMLRFHKLYIGRLWTTEYGNPDDPKDREYISRYSPIHNIGDVSRYPPILVYTGLHDDRVHPSHAFRYVAKMRDLGAKIYLRTDTVSGHLGASLERKKEEYVDILSFIYRFFKLGDGGA